MPKILLLDNGDTSTLESFDDDDVEKMAPPRDPILILIDTFFTELLIKNKNWKGDWLMQMAIDGNFPKMVEALLHKKARFEVATGVYVSVFPCKFMNINWCHMSAMSKTYIKLFIGKNIFKRTDHSNGGVSTLLSRCEYNTYIDEFVSKFVTNLLGEMLQYWVPMYEKIDFKPYFKSYVISSLIAEKMRIISIQEQDRDTKPLFALQSIDNIIYIIERA